MKKILVLFAFTFLLCAAAKTQTVEGYYKVGKTYCTIEQTRNSYAVYWDNGTGNTVLTLGDLMPNGNVVFEEYEDDGRTYDGKFIFANDDYWGGTYVRNDGKKFKISKIR
jgi:hypothetical protein